MIHDILSENVRKEIDSIRSKFPHDKNKAIALDKVQPVPWVFRVKIFLFLNILMPSSPM